MFLLQKFIIEQTLNYLPSSQHTFFHHSGRGSSQIDYILSTDISILQSLVIGNRNSVNTSSHVKVAVLISNKTLINRNSTSKTITGKKLNWEKANKSRFEEKMKTALEKMDPSNKDVDQRLEILTKAIHSATKSSVPQRVVKLKGPKWKASPSVKNQLKICKAKYEQWINSGKCNPGLKKRKYTSQASSSTVTKTGKVLRQKVVL